jgi:NAD(P)-dependent dehydrogenase (short-subunit alcohol dehydrogenase family)
MIPGLADSSKIAPNPRLRNKVVVITGASAGVGRATARAFARAGAKVALIARDPSGLESARAEIAAMGGEAKSYPADVSDPDAVFDAAKAIESQLGPIEIWVNNAMTTVFSPVEEITPDEIRRVTEVTYLGTVHGTMAALKHMRPRNRGTIVQVGSALAYRGIPLQAAYCAAKHAIRGFTDSLRTELQHKNSNIRLTAVHLPAVNTPQFDWARTHRRKLPRPVAPVYKTAVAARAILHAALHPTREYWLGGMTPLMIFANMLFPGLMDKHLAANAVEGQARKQDTPPGRRDNLFKPVTGTHRTDGSFGAEARSYATLLPAPASRVGAVVAGCLVAGLIGAALGTARSDRR